MISIYRSSFRFFRDCFLSLLVFAVVIEGLLWFMKPRSEAGITFAALTIIAYYFHRYFLFGEALTWRKLTPAEGAPPIKFGWFMLISAGLILVPVGVVLIFSFSMVIAPDTAVILALFALLYLLILSMFGTALPAMVARDGTYAVSQGIRATHQTMWRLVLGPGVVGAILLALTVGTAQLLEGVPENSPIMLVWFIAMRTFGFLTTIIAVAVLCEMYRRTRPGALAGAPE